MNIFTRFIDGFGRHFSFNAATQTEDNSRIAQLNRRYSTHPASGLTPARAAEILLEAERGDLMAQAELAEDMEEKDAHLQSELGKRRRAIQALDGSVKPPRNPSREEQRDVDMLNEIITDLTWLDECIYDGTDAILKSYSAQELIWSDIEGLHIPSDVAWRDPSWFQTHPENRNQLRLCDGTYEGAELQPFGWMLHQAKSKSGYLARTGLMRTLVWPFIFKNYSVRDLAEFLEIYGLPIRVGQYPAGATEKEKRTLLDAVMSVGHNAGGIIPRSMMIDFKNAADGTADPFLAMMSWAELSMSKAILGGTLTSQADGASSTNALGNVHNEVRFEVRDSDAKQLAATLTRDLIYPMYVLNCKSFNNQRRLPRWEFDLSVPEDVTAYATSLPSLVGMGMKIPVSWAHDKLQIPQAGKDEVCLTAPAVPDFSGAMLSAKTPGWVALSAQPEQAQNAIGAMPGAITGEQWKNAIDPILQPVIDALNSGGYEAAKSKAAELYSEMDDGQITDMLHRAMFVAELWGRANATAG